MLPLILLTASFDSPLVAPGAKLERLAGGFAFTEGPATDREGNVYFSDQPNDRIVKWSVDGKVEDWLKPAGRANGLTFDPQGNLIACADGTNELWSIAPDRRVTVLVRDFGGKLLNGPNDVWVRRDGAMFFTDPMYPRDYWRRDPAIQPSGEHVYYLSPNRKSLRAVATDLEKPNGIVGTPDGKTLYVSDIGAGKTYRYALRPDGTLAEKALFCEMGSDGMTLDERGNLYLTNQGVTVFSPQGERLLHIPVPEPWTGNVTFAGKDGRLLFITASKGIYRLRMAIRGAERVKGS